MNKQALKQLGAVRFRALWLCPRALGVFCQASQATCLVRWDLTVLWKEVMVLALWLHLTTMLGLRYTRWKV
ncbi:hypothetical protein SLEP1_g26990 [Rubroshorea leprosula]|uniref:Uncharacterized protein n=1 Tax=Rubroshorea leprosula TaxID=152421 RepID=A0AAV5JRR6_9ROSI|nr:hypothetical protein SLEP1_g26990 [Rubroshorea leprosula]